MVRSPDGFHRRIRNHSDPLLYPRAPRHVTALRFAAVSSRRFRRLCHLGSAPLCAGNGGLFGIRRSERCGQTSRVRFGNDKPMNRKVLITGGAGFIGSNLAHRLLRDTDASVHIIDNLARPGVQHNLRWLCESAQMSDGSRLRTSVSNAGSA